MTPAQEKNEADSIDAFVAEIMEAARYPGMDAGTTYVIVMAARAAATMAPRTQDGSIDAGIATEMLRRAARGLARLR